jgi:hypothetical protein
MRNGEELTGNDSFQISLSLMEVSNKYRDSVYQSRLTVTGTHLGVYAYSVFNRAMQDWRNSSVFIEGMVKRQLGFISRGVVLIDASNYNYRGPICVHVLSSLHTQSIADIYVIIMDTLQGTKWTLSIKDRKLKSPSLYTCLIGHQLGICRLLADF